MTLKEAIKDADSRSRNMNLHWFVCVWNAGYIIHSSTHMRRFPDTKYVYSTGELQSWKVIYNEEERRFKHIVKKLKMGKEEALKIAEQFVEGEKMFMQMSNAVPAIITHRGKQLLGSIASIIPSDAEIVLCAHTSFPVGQEIVDAVKEISPDRLLLTIDDELDLAPRQDVMRKVGNKLTKMTTAQTKVAHEELKGKDIIEING